MPQSNLFSFGPLELVAAAFSLPLFSLVIALLVAAGILVVASRPRREDRGAEQLPEPVTRSVRTKYLPEHRALGIAAIAVIVLFAVESVVRGYLLNLIDLNLIDHVSWLRYATPVFSALLGISVILGLIVTRGTTPPESPVLPAARRTWLSFSPRRGLVSASITLLALVATIITAGLASSPDGQGRHVWLVIPVPNEAAIDPIRVGFYGWAYGLPVLICLAVLTIVTWATLHTNAARPYIRPETVTAERDARREVAIGTVRIATAGMLLALAGASRLIASAGTVSRLTINGQNGGDPYEVAWRHAELAAAAGWLAPALEITAFVLLLLVASRLRRTPTTKPSEKTELKTGVEAML